jgi:hypothetical protein
LPRRYNAPDVRREWGARLHSLLIVKNEDLTPLFFVSFLCLV